MRDLRLSFWAAVHGAIGLFLLIVLRTLAYMQNALYSWVDVVTYILSLVMLLFFMRAIRTGMGAVAQLHHRRGYLIAIYIGLVFLLLYQIVVQALKFVADIKLADSYGSRIALTIISIISMIGVFGYYVYWQMRGKKKLIAALVIALCCAWVVLRLLEQVILPLLAPATGAAGDAYTAALAVAAINKPLSMVIYSIAFIGLLIYSVQCGRTVRKMPESKDR